MKVYIGPYKNWFGPYQLAEKLMFWVPKEKDEYGFKHTADRVHHFGEWLAHGSIEPEPEVGDIRKEDRPHTWLYKFLSWIDSKKKRKIEIHIDRWDTWSMDNTLALIVLPMLKQLRDSKHGYSYVDIEDVPEKLRLTEPNEWDSQLSLFDVEVCNPEDICIGEDQWNWVLNEMIFAFESKVNDDWQNQFESGEHDIQWKELENGNSQMIKGPNDTKEYDWDSIREYEARMQNGFRLFGKYYQNLWD